MSIEKLSYIFKYRNLVNTSCGLNTSTMFSDYPLTLHDQIHDFVVSRALSLITCQKHVLVCKIKSQ